MAQIAAQSSTKINRRLLSGLHTLLSDAIDLRPPRKRLRGSRSSSPRRQRTQEPDELVPTYQEFEEPDQPSDEEIDEGGAAAPEAPGRKMMAVDTGAIVPETALGMRQRFMIAKTRSRAIASSAQGLLVGSDRLQLVDLETAERAIAVFLRGTWKPSQDVARGALAASVSLLSGRSIEHSSSLRVIAHSDDVPKGNAASYLVLSPPCLLIAAPRLHKPFVPKTDQAHWYKAVQDRLALPLPSNLSFSELLMQQARHCVGRQLLEGAHWDDCLLAFTRELNKRKGARLTPVRIAEFVSRQVVALNSDWADAMPTRASTTMRRMSLI